MAKFALNKSSLQKERERLQLLQRLLPSLDLKRRQLLLELQRAQEEVRRGRDALLQLQREIGGQLPMLANQEIDVGRLVRLEEVAIGQENVVGVRLPRVVEVRFQRAVYSLLAKPAWVDVLVQRLEEAVSLRVQLLTSEKRAAVLQQAVRRITQRVNLFEKILIPQAQQNIKKIQVFLGDAERAAVVRAKLAKRKRQGGISGREVAG